MYPVPVSKLYPQPSEENLQNRVSHQLFSPLGELISSKASLCPSVPPPCSLSSPYPKLVVPWLHGSTVLLPALPAPFAAPSQPPPLQRRIIQCQKQQMPRWQNPHKKRAELSCLFWCLLSKSRHFSRRKSVPQILVTQLGQLNTALLRRAGRQFKLK